MGAVGYLLDTHTFLWAVRGGESLSETATRMIFDVNVQLYLFIIFRIISIK